MHRLRQVLEEQAACFKVISHRCATSRLAATQSGTCNDIRVRVFACGRVFVHPPRLLSSRFTIQRVGINGSIATPFALPISPLHRRKALSSFTIVSNVFVRVPEPSGPFIKSLRLKIIYYAKHVTIRGRNDKGTRTPVTSNILTNGFTESLRNRKCIVCFCHEGRV